MSFNKRHLSIESLILYYKRDINELIRYVCKPDSLSYSPKIKETVELILTQNKELIINHFEEIMSKELNEIKKALYRENPIAFIKERKDDSILYDTELSENRIIEFNVPLKETVNDEGVNIFDDAMPAKHLIRWIVK